MFGQDREKVFKDVWRYSFASAEWVAVKTAGDDPGGRAGHTCAAIGSLLYVFGGRGENNRYLDTLFSLDTEKRVWREIKAANPPSPRMFHAAAVVKDRYLVVIGGRTEPAIDGSVYVYDASAQSWSPRTVSVGERMYHRAVWIAPMIVVIGGIGGQDSKVALINVEKRWELAECREHGNTPGGIARFALVQLGPARCVCFGGTDAVGRIPYACAWALDCEGSLVANSAPPPNPPPKRTTAFSRYFRWGSRKDGPAGEAPLLDSASAQKSKSSPRLGKPVKFVIPPPVPQIRPLDVGTRFDADAILQQLNISIDGLQAMEQMATNRKVRMLYNARVENQKLDEKMGRLEMIASGRPGLPPRTPLLLKLYDDVTKMTRILKVSSFLSADELTALAKQSCRGNAIIKVQTSPTNVAALKPRSLLEAHSSICKGEQANLVILVL
jgi:hypothetical protein